ncbi:MAG TPA: hypothetical protein VMF56_04510 [Acidobacteriaceae bacterium]|nr:hypothetical protein [Acidobacteriaceae bacterium]
MKRLLMFFLVCSSVLCSQANLGQNLQSYVSDMNKALGEHGSVVLFDGQTLVFSFVVPGPVFIFTDHDTGNPKTTAWTAMSLDVESITANLKSLNEETISDWTAFSPPYFAIYKPGDTGDETLVEFSTIRETLMSTVTVDRDKLAKLKPGNVTEQQLGAKTVPSKHAMIVFPDRLEARAFEKALRAAIVAARAQ